MVGVLGIGEVGDFLEEASDVCGDVQELNLGVLAEADVSVVPAEVVVVRVVVMQYLACLSVIKLEPVGSVTGVVVVFDGEHLDTPAGDGTVQFQWVAHLLCPMTS